MIKYLVVGLGNPTKKYEDTRHNVGFMVIDSLAKDLEFELKFSTDFKGDFCKFKDAVFLKPQTYMNLSGESLSLVANYFKIENIIVMHDDLDINFGEIRFKSGGGSGGHNGLKSIDSIYGNGYDRARIGIGRPKIEGSNIGVSDYVLSSFSKDEIDELPDIIAHVKNGILEYIKGSSLIDVQNRFTIKTKSKNTKI